MCHEIVASASYSGDIANVSVAAIAGDKLTVDVRLGTTRRTKITLSPTYVHTVSVRKQFAQLLTNYSRISASCQGSNDSLHGCVTFVAGTADRRPRSCSAQTTAETRHWARREAAIRLCRVGIALCTAVGRSVSHSQTLVQHSAHKAVFGVEQ